MKLHKDQIHCKVNVMKRMQNKILLFKGNVQIQKNNNVITVKRFLAENMYFSIFTTTTFLNIKNK